MIVKSFELNKIDLKNKNFYLLYGENQGFKDEVIQNEFKKSYSKNIYNYEENEILKNKENFFDDILSKSFFENDKLVIISRVTDKFKEIIEEIIEKNIDDVKIILNSNILEKKSKLRSFFEKSQEAVCVPFYEDNNQTLIGLINNFFRNHNISMSQQSINILVDRCRGDRRNLNNELEKIQSYLKTKDKINNENILRLTNLAENYSISELVDSCLAKNKSKTLKILNENNYSIEECIIIIRTFLTKSKKLLKLRNELKNKKNIDDVISSSKPPIFWKDKETVKLQLKNWSYKNIEILILDINNIELLIKKNSSSSINILLNFILEQTTRISNGL